MAKGLNTVYLIGNLGRDPETRYTPNNTAVTNFSVATAESEKRGERWEDHTEWHNVVCFGRTAEVASEYLRKGSRVHIQGKLRTSSWEKDGVKKYRTEIICRDLTMLDGKSDRTQQSGGGNKGWQTGGSWGAQPPAKSDNAQSQADFDDEIPF